jgi:hypothetical protein
LGQIFRFQLSNFPNSASIIDYEISYQLDPVYIFHFNNFTMTLRELIKQAIDQAPDEQLAEILDFIRFIGLRKNPNALQELLEDLEDIRDAEAALSEKGGIPAEEFFKELGI